MAAEWDVICQNRVVTRGPMSSMADRLVSPVQHSSRSSVCVWCIKTSIMEVDYYSLKQLGSCMKMGWLPFLVVGT